MESGLVFERDVAFGGGAHGIRIANDAVELIAATDYGPRVLLYAPRGGENVFGFLSPEEQSKPTSFGQPWHIYGGHRLWHAPEHEVLSYVPDNDPVEARLEGTTLVLRRATEEPTSLGKELRLTLDERGSRVVVEHRIENRGRTPTSLAVWALSLMAQGGAAIVPNAPFVPFPDALLPSSRLVLWPYTSLGDPRFRFGRRHLRLSQDPRATAAQKAGFYDAHNGWAAYACGDRVFLKRYAPAKPQQEHVDLGCNVEVFTDARILELETLGPRVELAPGEHARHVEHWYLFAGVELPDDDDAAEQVLTPLLARTEMPLAV